MVTIQIQISEKVRKTARALQAISHLKGGNFKLSHFYQQIIEDGATQIGKSTAIQELVGESE